MVPERLLKPYNPQETEERIYRFWQEGGWFQPENNPAARGRNFSLLMPPPNATGRLHLGHAAGLTIEDIISRFQRMRGNRVLWLPGTDHAALATQAKVEKLLWAEEKKTRRDLGQEEFLRRVESFVAENRQTIVRQIKKIGASADWRREAFTLDEPRGLAVRTAFKKLYDEGLIYRGDRIVHWDPKLKTTLSDEEVSHEEEKTPLYYLQYGPFVIATARPETKFGDKYVVVHPADKRYGAFRHGQKLEVEWLNGKITATVIKDEAVDPAFGTGAMTITPWHDAADFEIALRHNLEREPIIDLDGRLLPIAGEFAGLGINQARPSIVAQLKSRGLLVKVDEDYRHQVAKNERSGALVEPQIMRQWFVAVSKPFRRQGRQTSLRELARAPVADGRIKIIPDRFTKIYLQWIDNLHDWCVSRQIWYGHRLPVWYCRQCPEPVVEIETPPRCPRCGGALTQDPDTLDTWFSSGLWTFSTLGWPTFAETATAGRPGPKNDLANFHPTDVLETAYDILFFWVARMVMLTGYLLDDIPFRLVYLHGLVRDEGGKKMSKSLGNIIDPEEMIAQYGADAMRLSLVAGTSPGNDSKISEQKIRGYQRFANKIWNIGRFVLTHAAAQAEAPPLAAADRRLLDELTALVNEVTADVENYRFYLAAEKLYHYFWHQFADKIIEAAKPRLKTGDAEDRLAASFILTTIFITCLKLLHPFMPFITEELWSLSPPREAGPLITEPWPRLA